MGAILMVQVDNLTPIVTHSIESRELCYPWHPWYGRRPVWIHKVFVKSGRAVYQCSLEQNHEAWLLEIPQWMFESCACCRVDAHGAATEIGHQSHEARSRLICFDGSTHLQCSLHGLKTISHNGQTASIPGQESGFGASQTKNSEFFSTLLSQATYRR